MNICFTLLIAEENTSKPYFQKEKKIGEREYSVT